MNLRFQKYKLLCSEKGHDSDTEARAVLQAFKLQTGKFDGLPVLSSFYHLKIIYSVL